MEVSYDAQGHPFMGSTHTGAFFAAGGLPTSTPPTYSKIAVPYAQLGDMCSVSLWDQAAGRSFHDVLNHQKLVKAQNTRLIEEWALIHGNSGANPLEFDGLNLQCTVTIDYNAYLGQTLALFNCLADACQQISEMGGVPRCIVLSYRAKTELTKQVLQLFYAIRQVSAGVDMGDLQGGISIGSWDFGWGSVDFIPSRYLRPTEYGGMMFVLDDKSTEGANNGSVIQLVDLLPVSGYDLAFVQTAFRYVVLEITALMLSIPAWQRKIINTPW